MCQSEQHVNLKMGTPLSPAREMANFELAEIIDAQAIQSLMDDFYKLAHIPIGIIDLKGNILVGVGWQDICTKFHRIHPESCKHCVESDTKLSAGVLPGEFKPYKCKNNMWDIATPIMVGSQHVGNIFLGQFFFDDEPLDYELFRSQARKYGFNGEEYIAALEKVPRLSKETVDAIMLFFMKFANMLSQLSYSNVKLSQSLAERNSLVEELKKSEKRFRSVLENSLDSAYCRDLQNNCFDYMSPVIEQITGFSAKETDVMSLNDFLDHIHPDDLPLVVAGIAQSLDEGFGAHEYRFKCKNGKYRWLADHFSIIKDETGMARFRAGIARDITERKKVEEALKLSSNYNRSLIEASLDPLVTIGRDGKIKDVNGATEQVTGHSRSELIGTDFSDYFTEPEKAHTGYQQVFIDGEVRDYPLEIQHKEGYITPVLYNASIYRDENGEVIGVFAAARDVSEHKRTEEALKKAHENLEEKVKERTAELEEAYKSLKESEKGLAEAQRMAHIGNWDWDLITDKVYWSDEMYRIFERSPQESLATYIEFLNYIHPDDRDYVNNTNKKALKGEPIDIDHRIILANGEERIVHAQAEVIFDEENRPIRLKGIVQDITERKKAEEKIKILADAVNSSNDAIVTESLDGIITSWNKGAENIYGYSVEDILGKDVSNLEPANLKGEIKQLIDKIKQGERVKNYETLRVKKDGTQIYVSITFSPIFDASSKLIAVSAIARDITQRKRAEEALRESESRLRRFYESSIFGVLYYNLDGSITEANDKFLEIVGYTREDLQVGRVNWEKMTPQDYRPLDEYAMEELKATGGSVILEKEYIRKDGSHVPVILGVAAFDRGDSEGVAFVLDNTERKKTEKALTEIDKIRIKEIHHRIKNNLQVISSLLDLQAEKFRDKEVLEAFKESQSRVLSMSLIHEELYKGEGTDTLDFSAYLQKLAENLFKTYSFSSKNIRLYMDLEEKAFFDMDTAIPLGIIVNELVSNSFKHAFTENQEGEIRIRLFREGKNNEIHNSLFSLTISDNGKGIPENIELENLESLGLQLVNILVDQLDGEIEFKREQGTEFRITFNVQRKIMSQDKKM